MLTPEHIAALAAPFPAAEHKERPLPGNAGRWFFIPWQIIRQRLTEVDPCWAVRYLQPIVAADYVIVTCELTIHGVTRQGLGNDKAFPDKQTYGTPIERAQADAFKAAAEQFTVGAYLEDQAFVIRWLQSQGDGRGVQFGLRDRQANKPAPTSQSRAVTPKPAKLPDKHPPGDQEDTKLILMRKCFAKAKEIGYSDGDRFKAIAKQGLKLTSFAQAKIWMLECVCQAIDLLKGKEYPSVDDLDKALLAAIEANIEF